MHNSMRRIVFISFLLALGALLSFPNLSFAGLCYNAPPLPPTGCPLSLTCTVSSQSVNTGIPVTWNVAVAPGTGFGADLSYSWSGSDPQGPFGTNAQSDPVSFTTGGQKIGTVSVNDGVAPQTCSASTNVIPPAQPTLDFYATYQGSVYRGNVTVPVNTIVALFWVAQNGYTSCSGTSSNNDSGFNNSIKGTNGSFNTQNLSTPASYTYTLSCGGSGISQTSQTVTITVSAAQCSYTYGAYGICSNGSQTRTVLTSTPAGCSGTPDVTTTCSTGGTSGGSSSGGNTSGNNTGGNNDQPTVGGIQNPLNPQYSDIYKFLAAALGALVNILIPIIVLFYVLTGLMFITARGNPAKLTVAKQAFLYTTIGAGVVLGAWVLAQAVGNTITAIQA